MGVGLLVMLIVAAAVALLNLRGDGFRLPGEADESAAEEPLVIILSPTEGTAEATVGQPFVVQAAGSDPTGVLRMDLIVDGRIIDSQYAPEETPLPVFTVTYEWTPDQAGAVIVGVVAYRANGVSSQPAELTVNVAPAQVSVIHAAVPVRPISNLYVEYVKDHSGSMLEGLGGGRTRLDLASEMIIEQVAAYLPETNIGLRAYGHRVYFENAGACEDIELVTPIQTDAYQSIVDWHDSEPQAQGMTPLALSLRQAATDFELDRARVNHIIMLSDGQETCGGDPCAVVKELLADNFIFSLHVIGMDVDATTAEQLSCMAAAGSGIYRGVTDEAELKGALDELSKLLKAGEVLTSGATEPATKEICAEGGTLTSADGLTKVKFPPGSLPKCTKVTYKTPLPESQPKTPDGFVFLGQAMELNFSPVEAFAQLLALGNSQTPALQVDTPFEICFSVGHLDADMASSIIVFRAESSEGNWESLATTVDISAGTACAMAGNQSIFGLFSPWEFSVTADPLQVTSGECTTLEWHGSGMASVVFDGDLRPPAGSEMVCPDQPTTYSFTAFGLGLSDRKSVAVGVEEPAPTPTYTLPPPTPTPTFTLPAPTFTATPSATPSATPTTTATSITPAEVSFRADSTNLTVGKCTTIRWDAEHAIAVFLDGEGVVGHDTRQVCPPTTTTYNLHVQAVSGDVDQSITINVNATPTATATALR